MFRKTFDVLQDIATSLALIASSLTTLVSLAKQDFTMRYEVAPVDYDAKPLVDPGLYHPSEKAMIEYQDRKNAMHGQNLRNPYARWEVFEKDGQ